jgi:CheY-like chemotaxis protein
MNALIDSVYFYTRPDDGERMKREACDGNELVEAAKQNISRLMGERQAVIGCPPLPRLAVNREQIIQVLQHLLSNAIENCPVTPLVALTAEETPGHWSFRVSDNGSGISPPDAEKLFTPFRRLSRQDRHRPGLGLATCQKIIERHGGKIWFQANKAGGADFIFTLPKVEPQDAVWTVHQQAAHASMRPGANKRLATVLLVDDDDLAIDLTQIQLIEANRLRCRVLVAQDGHEALARLRDTQIDLVLLDINMPRMDGFELLDRMRAERMLDRVTVVMCSTSTYEEDISRAKDLGARGYLTKPPNFNRLRSILDSCGRLQILPGADAFGLLCAA